MLERDDDFIIHPDWKGPILAGVIPVLHGDVRNRLFEDKITSLFPIVGIRQEGRFAEFCWGLGRTDGEYGMCFTDSEREVVDDILAPLVAMKLLDFQDVLSAEIIKKIAVVSVNIARIGDKNPTYLHPNLVEVAQQARVAIENIEGEDIDALLEAASAHSIFLDFGTLDPLSRYGMIPRTDLLQQRIATLFS